MNKRECVRAINKLFRATGRYNDRLHQEFKKRYENKELAGFFIHNLEWFNGAGEIMEMVDELHTITTSIEEFKLIHKELKMKQPILSRTSKRDAAKIVKSNPNWRAIAIKRERDRLESSQNYYINKFFHSD